MAHTSWLLAGLAIAVPLPAGAQGRAINLTGAPLKAISEPFTQISGVRELPGGKVVVADRGEQKLMMVNFADGSLTPIGRKGGGPGEFQFPFAVFPAANNETWIADPAAGKVHIVTPDGKIPNAILPPEGDDGGPMMSMPRGVDAAGRLFYQGSMRPGPGGVGSVDSAPILRWDRLAKRVDTLGKVATGMSMTTSGSQGNVSVSIRSKPWASAPAWMPLPDGRVAVIHPSPYRVDFITLSKSVSKGPVQPYTPIKVTGAERDAFRAAQKSNPGVSISRNSENRGGAVTTSTSASNASGPPIPDTDFPEVMPPFSGPSAVRISPEGEVWVLRTRVASDKTPRYDIFDGNGNLVGKATLKAGSSVIGFGAGVVYVARQDPEDDLLYLEKYAR